LSDDPKKAYVTIDVGIYTLALQIPSTPQYCGKLDAADCRGSPLCDNVLGGSKSCIPKRDMVNVGTRPETISTPLDIPEIDGWVAGMQILGPATAFATLGAFGAAFVARPWPCVSMAAIAMALGVATLLVWKLGVEPKVKPVKKQQTLGFPPPIGPVIPPTPPPIPPFVPGFGPTPVTPVIPPFVPGFGPTPVTPVIPPTPYPTGIMPREAVVTNLLPFNLPESLRKYLDGVVSKMTAYDGPSFWLLLFALGFVVVGASAKSMAGLKR
jgi:hypothetical protein